MNNIIVHVPESELDHLLTDKGAHDRTAWWRVPTCPRRNPEWIYFESGGEVVARARIMRIREGGPDGPGWRVIWHGDRLEEAARPRAASAPARGYRYLSDEEARELDSAFTASRSDEVNDWTDEDEVFYLMCGGMA